MRAASTTAAFSDGTDTIAFSYGADRARYKQVNGTTGVTTLYIDGLFELETESGNET
jgi:hypothetical protein